MKLFSKEKFGEKRVIKFCGKEIYRYTSYTSTKRRLVQIDEKLNRLINRMRLEEAQFIVELQGVKFYVPLYPFDYLQRTLVDKERFYEQDILEAIDPYLPDDATILDIGANIGNHSIYWATRRKPQKIYSFEPIKKTFDFLEKNIEINNLQEIIMPIHCAIGDEQTKGSLDGTYDLRNIGESKIRADAECGVFEIRTIDDMFGEEERIDFIKIDVEGFEINVLRGGRCVLQKHRPTILIETFAGNCRQVHETLCDLGYASVKTLRGDNYLYSMR